MFGGIGEENFLETNLDVLETDERYVHIAVRQNEKQMAQIASEMLGFTKKNARMFFGLLRDSGAARLVDVRLNNVSQLAGFAKRDDLAFFVDELCGMDYRHVRVLAPTQDMLDDFKKHGASWDSYADRFVALMDERAIQNSLDKQLIDNSVLLCSEPTAHQCHRRLVAEYLAAHWEDVTIIHL